MVGEELLEEGTVLWAECIKISGIPQSIEERDLEKTVLDVFDKVDAPADPQNIEACQKLRLDNNCRSNKARFSKRKDMV